MLFKLLESHNKPLHEITFARIGNRPKAHYAAKNVFDGKKKADRRLTHEEIIKAIKTADGRLRGCLSTLVDARSMHKKYHKGPKKSGDVVYKYICDTYQDSTISAAGANGFLYVEIVP